MDILAILQRLGAGRMLERLETALGEVAEEVVRTGKPGTVTLTIKMHNREKGDRSVVFDEVVSRSTPKQAPVGAMFFVLEEGLYEKDPRQPELPAFRTVDKSSEVREAPSREKVERTIQ